MNRQQQIDDQQNRAWNFDLDAMPIGHYAEGKLRNGGGIVPVFKSWNGAFQNVSTAARIDNLSAWRKRCI